MTTNEIIALLSQLYIDKYETKPAGILDYYEQEKVSTNIDAPYWLESALVSVTLDKDIDKYKLALDALLNTYTVFSYIYTEYLEQLRLLVQDEDAFYYFLEQSTDGLLTYLADLYQQTTENVIYTIGVDDEIQLYNEEYKDELKVTLFDCVEEIKNNIEIVLESSQDNEGTDFDW